VGAVDVVVNALAYLLIYYLPAMVANASPVFVGRGTPVDGGKRFFDGRRVLGDGKTWEGVTLGILFGTTIACLESVLLNDLMFYVYGVVGSLGALIGDMISSFFKRRMGFKRGAPAPVLDQLDFYIGATLFMMAVGWEPKWEYVIAGAVLIVALHKITNLIAYYLHLKDVPW